VKLLRRKVSLRESYARKLKREATHVIWHPNGTAKRRKPLKKISRSKRQRLRSYYAVQEEFLSRPENSSCGVCIRLRERGENILLQPATECHHMRGRAGSLLTDERYFLPCCRGHREWIHEHPRLSREMGILAPASEWNIPVR
jgi:hypothetical protein